MGDAASAEPTEPGQPKRRHKRRLAVLTPVLLVAGLAALLAYCFGVFSNTAERHWPLDPSKIEVHAQAFREFFTVEKRAAGRGGRTLVLTLKRTPRFPRTASDFKDCVERAGDAITQQLVLETIAKHYVRCEYFDEKGEFQDFTFQRIAALASRETVELSLSFSDRPLPRRIVITY